LPPAFLYKGAVTTPLQDRAQLDHTRLDCARLDRLGLVLAVFALLLAPLGLLADKAVVPLALAAALAGGVAAGPQALPWRVLDRSLAATVGLLTAWCLVASAWSFHPLAAAALALRVGVLLVALLYLAGLAQRLEEDQRRRVRLAFCLGFVVTVLVLAVELAFGGPILTLLRGAAGSDYATASRLNRGVSATAILVWPLAALLWQRGLRWLALAVPPAVLGLILLSQSSASVLALCAGVLAAMLAGLGRPLARALARPLARAVMALAVVATLFGSPFAAGLAQQAGLTAVDWLPETARYRLHIWTVVSDRIAQRPLFGWGFDASPDLPAQDDQPFRPRDKIIPSHPHNGALQIMVETGLVGSLLTLALLFLLARRIDALAPAPRACAVAMLVTVLGIAATAYGVWQSHWLAMIGAAAALFIAVLPPAGRP
jgi:O-antigen ligase